MNKKKEELKQGKSQKNKRQKRQYFLKLTKGTEKQGEKTATV
jgi:hypothetical protein